MRYTGLVARQLDESNYDRWTRFVADAPSGSIYALPAYLDILCSAAGGTFSIDSLFRLHVEIHERKRGAPVYLPEAAFRRFVQRLQAQDLCRLFHARLPHGESVAAQLVLTGPHPVSHTVCAASGEAHLATGANPFLRWKAFEALAGLGYTGNDLTGAPFPHQVTRFKAQLGGELVTNWLVERPPTQRYRLRRRIQAIRKPLRRWLRSWRFKSCTT